MERRDFLRFGLGGAGAAAIGWVGASCTPEPPAPSGLFSLGVASGLHDATSVVLWTRPDPRVDPGITSVTWEVAADSGFSSVVANGSATVDPAVDRTVKVLVEGLESDRSYWYRFTAGTTTSPVGRARTLPAPGATVARLNLAYASCQSYANGFYASWRHIAARDVDAVLFLGDYIYESGLVQAFGAVRLENPATATTLDDYRAKYRLYRSDPDLQSAHAAHPFVTVWDDHEIHNDWDSTVFVTDPGRAAAAQQAWFEYQPVWPVDGTRIYRDLPWGSLGHIFMLDTRQYRGAHRGDAPLIGPSLLSSFETDPARSILGADQRTWLLDGLDGAQAQGTTWKIIGNQVMIAPIRVLDLDTPQHRAYDPATLHHAGLYTNSSFDSWDGFPVERDLILGHLQTAGVDNTVFVTGDYHSFWQAPLRTDFDLDGAPVVANEFAAGAISSAGGPLNENLLYTDAAYTPADPPFSYIDGFRNGYGLLEATADQLQVTYYAHLAVDAFTLPKAMVRFTLTDGDADATQQLLT